MVARLHIAKTQSLRTLLSGCRHVIFSSKKQRCVQQPRRGGARAICEPCGCPKSSWNLGAFIFRRCVSLHFSEREIYGHPKMSHPSGNVYFFLYGLASRRVRIHTQWALFQCTGLDVDVAGF